MSNRATETVGPRRVMVGYVGTGNIRRTFHEVMRGTLSMSVIDRPGHMLDGAMVLRFKAQSDGTMHLIIGDTSTIAEVVVKTDWENYYGERIDEQLMGVAGFLDQGAPTTDEVPEIVTHLKGGG